MQPKPKINIMKHITPVILALASLLIVGCDKDKAAIDAKEDATKNAINDRKDAVAIPPGLAPTPGMRSGCRSSAGRCRAGS